MAGQDPSPQTTLLILLGASDWPEARDAFLPAEAFAHAARAVKTYFLDGKGFGLPGENLLDRFDTDLSSDALDKEIGQFLERRLTEMKRAGSAASDLLLYFIGHGDFVGHNHDFYLAIRRTRIDNPHFSGLLMRGLAYTLIERARYLRRMLILDCCFASAAFSAFQGGPDQVALEKTAEAFPKKGIALLCSSGHTTPSRLLEDGSSTMFTKAFLDALTQGIPVPRDYLTLRDVKDRAADLLAEIPKAPKPFVHSPDQSEGDVADIPFFPNFWMERQRRLEEEKQRQAEEEHQKAETEKQRLHEEATVLPKTEEQASKAQEKTEAQPVRSAFEKAVDTQAPKVQKAREKPADQSENQLKTRDEFLEEALGSWAESFTPWFTAFALLAGLGIGAAALIRSSVPYSWVWSLGTVLVATPLLYLTAYRKVVPLSIMTIIALLSAAGAAGLAAYTSTFIHPSETNNLFLFGFSLKVSLDRQLYVGLIVGGGMGLFASVGGALLGDLDDPWELIWGSNLWGAIIWLSLAVLAFLVKWVSHVEWEFGFGYGWDISLMALESAILTPLGITYWLILWIKGAKVKIV